MPKNKHAERSDEPVGADIGITGGGNAGSVRIKTRLCRSDRRKPTADPLRDELQSWPKNKHATGPILNNMEATGHSTLAPRVTAESDGQETSGLAKEQTCHPPNPPQYRGHGAHHTRPQSHCRRRRPGNSEVNISAASYEKISHILRRPITTTTHLCRLQNSFLIAPELPDVIMFLLGD